MAAGWNNGLQGGALGFVETMGLVTAVVVADAMGKAAQVSVRTVLNADAGLISVVCEGGLGDCQAAVAAGRGAAEAMGGFLTANLIARPFEDTGDLVAVHAGSMFRPKGSKAGTAAQKPPAGTGQKPGTRPGAGTGRTAATRTAKAGTAGNSPAARADTGKPKGRGRKRTKG